jgi:hypothetical protein
MSQYLEAPPRHGFGTSCLGTADLQQEDAYASPKQYITQDFTSLRLITAVTEI